MGTEGTRFKKCKLVMFFWMMLILLLSSTESYSYVSTCIKIPTRVAVANGANKLCRNSLFSYALFHMVTGGHHDHFEILTAKNSTKDQSKFSLSSYIQTILSRPRLSVMTIGALFFIPSVLLRRKISRFDVTSLIVVTAFLSAFDNFRSATKEWIGKIKNFQESVMKHTTPVTKNYFFKNENAADRVTLLGVWINIVLSVTKFAGGIAFNSAVLVADAGHSLSDLLSDFITLWAVQIARIPADEDHPYGHGKFESIGSLFLSLTLLATGLGVGSWSYERMRTVLTSQKVLTSAATAVTALSATATTVAESAIKIPAWPALILAAISIASKEWLYRVTRRVGVLLNRQILIANAWHHRSDAFSSVLSLISIAAAILLPGFLVMDSAAGILIAGMISISGMEILFESIKSLSDTSDKYLTESIKIVTQGVDGVLGVRNIRTRSVGSNHLIDLTILTDTQLSASSAQSLSDRVRWKLLDSYPQVIDALIRTHSSSTPCPLLSVQNNKSPLELEKEIRSILTKTHKNIESNDVNSQSVIINDQHSSSDGSGGIDMADGSDIIRSSITSGSSEVSDNTNNLYQDIEEIKRVTIYYINPALVNAEIVVKLKQCSSTSSSSSPSPSSHSYNIGSNNNNNNNNSNQPSVLSVTDIQRISVSIAEAIKSKMKEVAQVTVLLDMTGSSVERETADNIATLHA